MTNLVTFPGLGLSFEINRVAFTIGGINIYWYGVVIAVGIMLATSATEHTIAATRWSRFFQNRMV